MNWVEIVWFIVIRGVTFYTGMGKFFILPRLQFDKFDNN